MGKKYFPYSGGGYRPSGVCREEQAGNDQRYKPYQQHHTGSFVGNPKALLRNIRPGAKSTWFFRWSNHEEAGKGKSPDNLPSNGSIKRDLSSKPANVLNIAPFSCYIVNIRHISLLIAYQPDQGRFIFQYFAESAYIGIVKEVICHIIVGRRYLTHYGVIACAQKECLIPGSWLSSPAFQIDGLIG